MLGWQRGEADSNFKSSLKMIHHSSSAIAVSFIAWLTMEIYWNVTNFHIIHLFSPTYSNGNATSP